VTDGYYELTRNWRIGAALAESFRIPVFLLLNLGSPEKIEVEPISSERLLPMVGIELRRAKC
jgi:hypothetical protein